MVSFYENPERPQYKRSPATIQAYNNKIDICRQFLHGIKLVRIEAMKFDKKLAECYYTHLLQKYLNNYSIRCIEIVSKSLKFGVSKDLIPYNPLNGFTLQRTPPEKPTYYSPSQMCLWENYKTDEESKFHAANLAVLQMHTGFDYGDFREINRLHLTSYKGRKYLMKPRQKNGNTAIIPLTEKAEAILEYYNYNMNLLSNPEYNEQIKIISKELGIDIYLKCKSLRKIFAMDQLNNKGRSMAFVSSALGHKRVKTTEQTYAQVNINLLSNELDRG